MGSHYKTISNSASIVLTGYPLTVFEFRNKYSNSVCFKQYNLIEVEPKFENDSNLSTKQIEILKQNIPIIVYTSEKYKFNVMLLQNEKKVSFSINEFKTENIAQNKEIMQNLIDCNLSNVEQIGFNFVNIFELHDNKKLKLLNSDIEKIKINNNTIWNNNKTFILSIPFDFSDHISTYKIQKLLPLKKESSKNRIYQVEVNQNFNIKADAEAGKNYIVYDIVKKFENLYNDEYVPMYDQFLKMYYEK